MISVRSYRTTYLCLKDDSYTSYCTDLSQGKQSTTGPIVFHSIPSPQSNNNRVAKSRATFSSLFVPPVVAAEWRLL